MARDVHCSVGRRHFQVDTRLSVSRLQAVGRCQRRGRFTAMSPMSMVLVTDYLLVMMQLKFSTPVAATMMLCVCLSLGFLFALAQPFRYRLLELGVIMAGLSELRWVAVRPYGGSAFQAAQHAEREKMQVVREKARTPHAFMARVVLVLPSIFAH